MESLVIALILTASSAATFLLLRTQRMPIRRPFLTLVVVGVTLAVSVSGELVPAVLDLLSRNGPALVDGQWWRVLSPLVVQDGGWPGTISNTISLLIVGALAESLVPRVAWLVVYVTSGLVGELAAYTIMPNQGFAGNSIAILGLAAMASVAVLARGGTLPRILAAFALALGIGLLMVGNLHGVSFSAGAIGGIIVTANTARGGRLAR